MSTIEDFYFNGERDILYVGNYLDYTTELGQSNANSGGILSVHGNGKMKATGRLPLPKALNARRIIELSDGRYLVVSNDDRTYLITL
jgi:hypothetical protein